MILLAHFYAVNHWYDIAAETLWRFIGLPTMDVFSFA